MSRSLLERRLTDLTARMRALREELGVADEQLAALAETAEEAQLRALVSETPLADRESEDATRHVEAMARHRAEVLGRLGELERAQDDLLDRLLAESK
jgi:hypothetical protein